MGWTAYHADNYYHNGAVNRKAECDSLLDKSECEVLKSAMVGSVYYAAVKKGERVFGEVILTYTTKKDYFNFGYKDMGESMLPFYYDCPESILDLLTETDDEEALTWRSRCREQAKKNDMIRELNKAEIGSTITVEFNGEEWELEKAVVGGRKRPIWVNWGKMQYLRPRQIVDCKRVA